MKVKTSSMLLQKKSSTESNSQGKEINFTKNIRGMQQQNLKGSSLIENIKREINSHKEHIG